MGITAEMSRKVDEFYLNQSGHLVNIGDWEESCRISSLVDQYCLKCNQCLTCSSVISLGEIDRMYKGSGLFSVGLLDIKDKTKCPFIENFEESIKDHKMLSSSI